MPAGFAARTPPAALAVFAVIAAPVLVGQATAPQEAKDEGPKPEAVKLSARLSGDEKRADGKAMLLLKAKGPAPTKVAVLTGDGGRTVVTASAAASPDDCKGLRARQASGEENAKKWCLELSGLDDGDEAAGTLAGTAVELTVSRRESYVGWPLLWAVGGLIVGAAVVLVPRWLRDGIRKATLDKALSDNTKAQADRKIVCLEQWVAGRRTAGDSDDALLPIVARTIRRAPAIAARARAELATVANSLKQTLAGHPALTAADTEARRTDHERSEFLDDEGEPVPHPAKGLAALLRTLAAAKQALDLAELAIAALPAGAAKDAAVAAHKDARGAYLAANKPGDAASVDDAVDNVERAVASAQDQAAAGQPTAPQIGILGARMRRLLPAPLADPRDDVTAARAATATPPVAAKRITGLIVLTVVVAAGVAAWALASLWLTVYEPKDAFGGNDYATLFVGAVGSGAAAAILTLVAAWDPLSPAEAE